MVSAPELAVFIHNIKPSTKLERRKYITKSCLLYPPFYLSFFCLNSSLLSAITNLRERPYGDLTSHPYWKIASISDLIGLLGYVILKWEEERLKYENLLQAKVRLVQWVNGDLPLFIWSNKPKSYATQVDRGESARTSFVMDDSVKSISETDEYQSSQVPNVMRTMTLGEQSSFADEIVETVLSSQKEAGQTSFSSGEKCVRIKNATEDFLQVTGCQLGGGARKVGDLLKETGLQVADMGLGTADVVTDFITQGMKVTVAGAKTLKQTKLGIEEDPDGAVAAIRSLIFNHNINVKSADGELENGLDFEELRLLLETMGVFLAEHALEEVFREIDDDMSGLISVKELLEYAKKIECQLARKNTRRVKYAGVLKRCCLTIGWWTSWSFIAGACFWVTLSFVEDASYFELKMYLGLTVVLYLCGALGNFTNLYRSTEHLTWKINSANIMLRAAAIHIGLDRSMQQETLDYSNTSRQSLGSDASDRMRQQLQGTRATIRRASMLSSYDSKVSTSPTSRRSGTSGSVASSDIDLWKEHDRETISAAQKSGAEALFGMIDVSNDGNIDEKELFDALSSLGVMIPTDAFGTIYKALDGDRNGSISVDEFCIYVEKIKPGMTKLTRRLTTLRYMLKEIPMYLVMTQVFAGSVQTHAAWVGLITVTATKNLFLAGSFGWAVGSFYFIFTWPKTKGRYFDQFETARFLLKAAILEGCRNWDISMGNCIGR